MTIVQNKLVIGYEVQNMYLNYLFLRIEVVNNVAYDPAKRRNVTP